MYTKQLNLGPKTTIRSESLGNDNKDRVPGTGGDGPIMHPILVVSFRSEGELPEGLVLYNTVICVIRCKGLRIAWPLTRVHG